MASLPIKRFTCELAPRRVGMYEDEYGAWVLYSDLPSVEAAVAERVRGEVQAAFDYILNVEGKLPGLHDIFDRCFPGWELKASSPDATSEQEGPQSGS